MKKGLTIALVVVLVAALGFGGWYMATNKDMTGAPYDEIEAFQAQHPHVKVSYSVSIADGVELDETSTEVTVGTQVQVDGLLEKAPYVQKLDRISLGDFAPTPQQLAQLQETFPDSQIVYTKLSVFGETVSTDLTELDWSFLQPEQVEEAAAVLPYFPQLEQLNLLDGSGNSALSIPDVVRLQEASPELHILYAFDLFGQRVRTDMERLEYFKVYIGDEGLEQFREILPLMYELEYLKLDWCETTDEAMAQLRDDFPEIKVVWRVFFSVFNCLTDTYKIWAIHGLMDKQIGPLKYCTEVRYLDLGHNYFTDLDFMNYMPHLKVAIVAIGQLENIDGIRNCKELEFLEIFSNRQISDLSPLSELTNLEYLNISNMAVRDLTPLDNLTKLKKLNCTLSNIAPEMQQHFKDTHPDCEAVFLPNGDPTDYGWRYDPVTGKETERYALLRKQIGYARDDVSQYPKGYLTHEINSLDDPD